MWAVGTEGLSLLCVTRGSGNQDGVGRGNRRARPLFSAWISLPRLFPTAGGVQGGVGDM